MGGVTVFEVGLSLPWHKPTLAKAVRTVYLRNAVIFQYNLLEAEQPPTQTSFSPSRTVCLVLSGGPTSVTTTTTRLFIRRHHVLRRTHTRIGRCLAKAAASRTVQLVLPRPPQQRRMPAVEAAVDARRCAPPPPPQAPRSRKRNLSSIGFT